MSHNKTVLITGASSGIGQALFDAYAQQNAQLIACGRNKDKLAELAQTQPSSQTLAFDVNIRQDIALAASQVASIDILILNAGDCQYIDDVMNFDGQAFSQVIATNLQAMGTLLHYFLPKLSANGQVVFISSSASIVPFPRAEAYGASKAGLDYLAKSLRLDLKAKGKSVTLVQPGFIKTPLSDKNSFGMPFILSSSDAAQRIVIGVEAKKNYLHFPKRLTLLLKLFAFLPDVVWNTLIVRSTKK